MPAAWIHYLVPFDGPVDQAPIQSLGIGVFHTKLTRELKGFRAACHPTVTLPVLQLATGVPEAVTCPNCLASDFMTKSVVAQAAEQLFQPPCEGCPQS